MTYGLSRMILLIQPKDLLSTPTKALVNVFWLLEANRLIIYGDNTLVSPGEYLSRDESPTAMKYMIILMVQAATFARRWANSNQILDTTNISRLFTKLEDTPEYFRCLDPGLDCLAQEGVDIREAILNCEVINSSEETPTDPYTRLAVIIRGALLLYHCRNFTFYSCWEMRRIPQIDQCEIDEQVAMILSQAQILLTKTQIPGVLLLFPLRMAGTHVISSTLQGKILDILYQIRRKGFVISDRIQGDLQEFWHHEWSTVQSGLRETWI